MRRANGEQSTGRFGQDRELSGKFREGLRASILRGQPSNTF
jgi:hypothetical protein